MKKLLLILLLPLALSAQFKVVAYYGFWSEGTPNPMSPSDINYNGIDILVHFGANCDDAASPYYTPFLHDIIADANGGWDSIMIDYGYGGVINGYTNFHVSDTLINRMHAVGGKVILSCGGITGTGSTSMSWMLNDSARTEAFCNAVVGFAQRRGYDGIEIDYEEPFNSQREAEFKTKSSMIARFMRRRMNLWNMNAILAVTAIQGNDTRYDPAIQDTIDYYFYMNYEMQSTISYNGCSVARTGFIAPLFQPDEALYPVLHNCNWTIDGHGSNGVARSQGVSYLADAGVSKSKIVVGMPFYGKFAVGFSAPGQTGVGGYLPDLNYYMVLDFMANGGSYNWDDSAKVPWVGGTAVNAASDWPYSMSAGQAGYMTYEDSLSVSLKTQWAIDSGYGGVMIFDLWRGWLEPGASPQDLLLRSVVQVVDNDEAPTTFTRRRVVFRRPN